MANTHTAPVDSMLVTFRRRRSGRVWQGRFEMGSVEANNMAAVREAWNTASEIVDHGTEVWNPSPEAVARVRALGDRKEAEMRARCGA